MIVFLIWNSLAAYYVITRYMAPMSVGVSSGVSYVVVALPHWYIGLIVPWFGGIAVGFITLLPIAFMACWSTKKNLWGC